MLIVIMLLSLLVLLTACGAPADPPTPIPTAFCTQEAKLPYPPVGSRRSLDGIVKWANTAASVANKAIDERDACRADYLKLRNMCSDAGGCRLTEAK